jgi:hypothetical protein
MRFVVYPVGTLRLPEKGDGHRCPDKLPLIFLYRPLPRWFYVGYFYSSSNFLARVNKT